MKKCACKGCSCKVSAKDGIKKGEKLFCSSACATGHKTKKGCCGSCKCSGK